MIISEVNERGVIEPTLPEPRVRALSAILNMDLHDIASIQGTIQIITEIIDEAG